MRASLTDDPRRRLCGRDDQHLLDVPASEPVAVMDRRTHEGITTGTVTLPRRPVHVGVWFRLLRTLLDEVNTPTSQLRRQLSKQALRQIWQTAGRPTRAGRIRWLPYEELDWPRQQAMLEAAAVAMHRLRARLRQQHRLAAHPPALPGRVCPTDPRRELPDDVRPPTPQRHNRPESRRCRDRRPHRPTHPGLGDDEDGAGDPYWSAHLHQADPEINP